MTLPNRIKVCFLAALTVVQVTFSVTGMSNLTRRPEADQTVDRNTSDSPANLNSIASSG